MSREEPLHDDAGALPAPQIDNLYDRLSARYGVDRWKVKSMLFSALYSGLSRTDSELEDIFCRLRGVPRKEGP